MSELDLIGQKRQDLDQVWTSMQYVTDQMDQDRTEMITNQTLSILNKNKQDRIQTALFDTRVISVQQMSDVLSDIESKLEMTEI